MSVRNLDKIFRPKRIAVVGASERKGSVGYTVLRNLISAGFGGVVYPVNPKREGIHGIQAYPNVQSLPNTPDLAVIAIPAQFVPDMIRECGDAGIEGVIILTAGFREAGDDGMKHQVELERAVKAYPRMRVVGPNCLGIMVPGLGLNATFAADMPKPGNIAFLSQSGALCTSVLDMAIADEIGFSYFVSVGNTMDVTIGDLIDYFGQDANTSSIILYNESIVDARQFMSASRAFARTKPIVAYKAGRFAESAQAAASHTGAMAAEDDVFDAALERAGIVRVYDVNDMFECAELLAKRRSPGGPNLAIVTNAGGPGVMATDALMERKGVLAALKEETIQKLDAVLPSMWSHGNPIDILGDAQPDRYAMATDIVLQDPGVDAALVVLTPQAMTDPTETARRVAEITRESRKPVLAAWMGAGAVAEGVRLLNQAGIPTYQSPERAVSAFMYLVKYARNIEILYETPKDIPVNFALDRGKLRGLFDTILRSGGTDTLSEVFSKALLDAYEIPTTRPMPARTPDEAAQTARRMGYPVVVKILSPEITHKTDVGGVKVNVRDDDDVRKTFEEMTTRAKEMRPDATIEGVTIQPMVTAKDGFEMILGAKKDPIFGSVIMVGAGGVSAELYNDRKLGLPPLNERLVRRMLESLKSCPILKGYRGKPAMNIDKLIEVIMRLSYLVADYPEIDELDINPLLVTPDDVVALDARVIINRELAEHPTKPFAHLAIPPYPEHYTRTGRMRDGRKFLLRPIKPEDEPRWHELLAACSPETIRRRFSSMFAGTTHNMAARYCFIDYDREMAIVAEVEEGDDRKIMGVGRLLADPDREQAEYAVLVADPWQGQGVGTQLTEYVLEIAEDWDLGTVSAVTSASNARMVHIFSRLGFELQRNVDDDVVIVTKRLREGAMV